MLKVNRVYSFILSPPERIKAEVARLKSYCKTLIGSFPSEGAIGHVTFSKTDDFESKVIASMIRRWKQDLKYIPSVELHIDNFSWFKTGETYVIYVAIEMNEYLQKWFKELKRCFNDTEKINPHITIARGLTKKQFDILWPCFENLVYRDSFIVNEATILAANLKVRGNGIGTDRNEVFEKISFGNKNVELRCELTLF